MAVSSTERLAAEPWSTGSFLKPWVLCVVATAGFGVAAFSFVSAFYSDTVTLELGEPLVVALLVNSITVSYVLGGLIAWTRRQESRFGPLMIAAGFANFLSSLSWTTHDVTYTIGQALDFVYGDFSADDWGDHPRARNAHCIRLFDYEGNFTVTIGETPVVSTAPRPARSPMRCCAPAD